MKIAIDVHSLGAQAGGNETYFRQLVKGLIEDKSDNAYTLFYTHDAAFDGLQPDARFTLSKISKNPLIRICAALPFELAKAKADIFHCQYIQPPFGHNRTVVTIHDLAHEHFPEFFHPLQALLMKKLVPWTARRAAHIFTVSHFCAADIAQKCGVAPEKITVAYQSPSPAFRPRDKQQCRQYLSEKYKINSPFILYVGRIQARKNLPRLIEAYARLLKHGIAVKLVIVGKRDWQSERVFQKITELRLESSVIFPGYVSFEDLPLFYNAAEVFVFPSFFEGFGLPVIESMASGVPTITSRGSSLEEVAGDGALLIDPYSVDSITGAMFNVLDDRRLRERLVESGLRRSAAFEPELASTVLDVYRQLL